MSAFLRSPAKTAFGGKNPLDLPLIPHASVLSTIPP
jgi:hypothetical protein